MAVSIRLRGKHVVWVLLCAFAAFILIDYFRTHARPMTQSEAPPEVEVARVEQENVPICGRWVGTLDGFVNANVKAQVTGYLLRQDYKEGSFVSKGQVLFEIDPRPFQAALDQAEGQLAQGKAQLAQDEAQLAVAEANQVKSQLEVDKYAPLAQAEAASQQDLDNATQTNLANKAQVQAAKAAIQVAKAQMQTAQAAVEAARINLDFTRLIAPVDGIAGTAQMQVGDLVSPNSPPVTTVSTVDPIRVYFNVSEQEYLDLNRRYPTEAGWGREHKHMPLQLTLADGTVYPHEGRVYFADRQVDQNTGTIRIAGLFPNPGNILRPGGYGQVRACTDVRKDALLVPQRAVLELQGDYQVAVVRADNRVMIEPVKVGERFGDLWIINEGLKKGERVVVEGVQKVHSGMEVVPKPFVKG